MSRRQREVITREHAVRCCQNVGRRHGYAVAVHGTLLKDVDLIAVPWVSWAHPALELAEALAESLPGVLHITDSPGPHGRRSWTIAPRHHWGDDYWFIDLSIMPRTAALPRRHYSELPGAHARTYRAQRRRQGRR